MKIFKYPKFIYFYTFCFIILIVILSLSGIIYNQFRIMKNANIELNDANGKLINEFEKIVEFAESEDGEVVIIKSKEDIISKDAISELDAMKLFNSQFDSFKSDWQALITIFTILVSVFAIAIPMFNYMFVVKD